ncbi:unnamed protein product [Arabidopsis thaliana]|uniref:Uncharacterized protein n=1 Tax=Arabidopsis thaliana TaxID=3702 RepID=A0A5S9XB64_ARATH|nr:unnamed protein product [Arabidopsis thaliana]VYS57059.1 unnamed protein product [Arabidopsis thaliana]
MRQIKNVYFGFLKRNVVLKSQVIIRQLELSKAGPSKLGFDGEEDAWVFVKKQRLFIVSPSLPLPQQQHFTLEKPAISPQLEAGFRESMEVTQDSTFVHTVVPSLPLPEHFIRHKPETSESQAELRDVLADPHKTTHVPTMKPASSQSQVEFRDVMEDTHGTTPLQTEMSSLPLPQHFVLQKPAGTSQSKADTRKATLVHTVMPSLPVPEHYILQFVFNNISEKNMIYEFLISFLFQTFKYYLQYDKD